MGERSRQREQRVQKPQGGQERRVFEEQRKGQCHLSAQRELKLQEVKLERGCCDQAIQDLVTHSKRFSQNPLKRE